MVVLAKLELIVAHACRTHSLVAHTNKCGHAIIEFWLCLVGTNLHAVSKMSQSLLANQIQSHLVFLPLSSSELLLQMHVSV